MINPGRALCEMTKQREVGEKGACVCVQKKKLDGQKDKRRSEPVGAPGEHFLCPLGFRSTYLRFPGQREASEESLQCNTFE